MSQRKKSYTLHVTTATRKDLSEITKRHKATTESRSWRTARQIAWAWIRGMSGIRPWPAPLKDNEDGFVSKRERPRQKPKKAERGLRPGGSVWWKVTIASVRARRKASAALLKSAEVQKAEKAETP